MHRGLSCLIAGNVWCTKGLHICLLIFSLSCSLVTSIARNVTEKSFFFFQVTHTLRKGTHWVHVSAAVNKAEWMLVDGSRIRKPDLVALVGLLSGSCTAANVSLWVPRFYELIFAAFDWFRILLNDHLLILTHAYITYTITQCLHRKR